MTGILTKFHASTSRSTPAAEEAPGGAGGSAASTAPASLERTGAPGMPDQRPGAKPAGSRKQATRAAGFRERLGAMMRGSSEKVADTPPLAQEPAAPKLADPMTRLPPEISAQVLGELDPKSLGDASLVNTHWNRIASAALQHVHVGSPAELAQFAHASPDRMSSEAFASAAARVAVGGMGTLELGGGKYTRADFEQLPAALRQSLRTLDLGHGATLTPDAWALVAELPSLKSLRLGRGAVPDKATIARLNDMPGLKSVDAQLRSPTDFDAIAACTKPLQLRIDGRATDESGDTEISNEDLAKIPRSTTALTVARPLPGVTGDGWAALNELPRLNSLQVTARYPRDVVQLASSTKLTRLELAEQPFLSTDRLREHHLAGLPKSVQEIAFHEQQPYLSEAFWTALSARPAMRSISTFVGQPEQLARLAHCDKLKSLDLKCMESKYSGPYVTDTMIAALPRGLEDLRVQRPLLKVRPETWVAMNDREALRRLDVVGTTPEELRALSGSTKITGLDFSRMTSYGNHDIAELPSSLRRLSLGASLWIRPATLDKLREAHPDLERFELHVPLQSVHMAMEDFGPSGLVTALNVRDIAPGTKLRAHHMKGLPASLRELKLHAYQNYEGISSDLARQWRELPLERLEIHGIPVSGKVAGELASHPTLRSLKAEQAGLTNDEAVQLASSTSLRHLDLTDNKVGDRGLQALLANDRLKSVTAPGNIPSAQLRQLFTGDRPPQLDEPVF